MNNQPWDEPPRSDSGAQRAGIAAAFALGVPHDYGRIRGLRRLGEPARLVPVGYDIRRRAQWMAPAAARAWLQMHAAAKGAGVELQIVSAFRSVEYQLGIIRRKLASGLPMPEILRVSAAPGYSEHHSGRALDVTTPGFRELEEEFEDSAAFAWLSTNGPDYGFRLSYPRDNAHGIAYEPWHWCWRRTRSEEQPGDGTPRASGRWPRAY